MMSEAQAPVPHDHPLMVAWKSYKKTEAFANTRKWAAFSEHVDGSLWAAFEEGYHAALKETEKGQGLPQTDLHVLLGFEAGVEHGRAEALEEAEKLSARKCGDDCAERIRAMALLHDCRELIECELEQRKEGGFEEEAPYIKEPTQLIERIDAHLHAQPDVKEN